MSVAGLEAIHRAARQDQVARRLWRAIDLLTAVGIAVFDLIVSVVLVTAVGALALYGFSFVL